MNLYNVSSYNYSKKKPKKNELGQIRSTSPAFFAASTATSRNSSSEPEIQTMTFKKK